MSLEAQIKMIAELRDKSVALRDRAIATAEKHTKDADEYETTISVLTRLAVSQDSDDETASPTTGNYHTGSIASRILGLLKTSEQVWWTAGEIQEALSDNGDEVKITSISPNLSRLKDNNDIVRDDFKVALANRALQNTEAPKGEMPSSNPDGASKDHGNNFRGTTTEHDREVGSGGGTWQ